MHVPRLPPARQFAQRPEVKRELEGGEIVGITYPPFRDYNYRFVYFKFLIYAGIFQNRRMIPKDSMKNMIVCHTWLITSAMTAKLYDLLLQIAFTMH